jgi:hypothetical protein
VVCGMAFAMLERNVHVPNPVAGVNGEVNVPEA